MIMFIIIAILSAVVFYIMQDRSDVAEKKAAKKAAKEKKKARKEGV